MDHLQVENLVSVIESFRTELKSKANACDALSVMEVNKYSNIIQTCRVACKDMNYPVMLPGVGANVKPNQVFDSLDFFSDYLSEFMPVKDAKPALSI